MGKIPDFNSYGNLPAGVYTVSLDVILARFLLPKSNQRKVLTASLEQFVGFVKVHAEAILIDGSYTTSKLAPRDVDICLLLRADFDFDSPEGNELSRIIQNKKRYHLHIIPGHINLPSERDLVMWHINYFQKDRSNRPKGIISLELNDD